VVQGVVDARKERIDESAAWILLKNAEKINVAKGKSTSELYPNIDSRMDVLKFVMGPSGNLRAPAIAVGNEFVIGFNADLYRKVFLGK